MRVQSLRPVQILTIGIVGALGVVEGCKSAHPPGPVVALYMKDGGPSFEKSPGAYDPLTVSRFFEAHPDVLPSFVDHGVCSLKIDPKSDEATANSVICQSAASVSFGKSLKKYEESNR